MGFGSAVDDHETKTDAGEEICTVMHDHGLHVYWNGDPMRRIMVSLEPSPNTEHLWAPAQAPQTMISAPEASGDQP